MGHWRSGGLVVDKPEKFRIFKNQGINVFQVWQKMDNEFINYFKRRFAAYAVDLFHYVVDKERGITIMGIDLKHIDFERQHFLWLDYEEFWDNLIRRPQRQ